MAQSLFSRWKRFMQTDLWRMSPEEMSPLRFLFLEAFKKVVLAVRFFTAKRVVNDAAALTYSTLLAIVPILAVVFAVARGFGYNRYIETWFRSAFSSQPQAADVIVGFVNSYLVHTKSGIFLGFGLIFMLYTVLMLVSNIENAFNGIWQVKKQRSIFRTFTDYLAMLFMLPIVIVLTSGVSIFFAAVADHLPYVSLVTPTMRFVIDLSPYVLMSALFIGLYVFMPNTHVRLSACVAPGILAGVAMQGVQLFYIHSQMWVSSYNAIYGSFAALPLFMLWVQISWTICLFGAELCYTNQNLDFYDYDTTTGDISHRYQMMLCAMLLGCMCRRFERGGLPYTSLELRRQTDIPIRIVNDLLYRMIDCRLVIEVSPDEKGEAARFMPAMSPHSMSVGDMVAALEAKGKWRIDLSLHHLDEEQWRHLMEVRTGYLHGLDGVLVKDLWKDTAGRPAYGKTR